MQITLNGRIKEIDGRTAFAVRRQFGAETDIVILNGFQIDQDRTLSEKDSLTIIRKGVMPAAEELENMMMARHTPAVHEKLKQGRVAIAGLGGLGSNVAVMLTRVGVGQLLLVDFDIVEPSNLNRQSYYICHLGMAKTLALKKQLAEINPFIQVETQTLRVEAENVVGLFHGYDILCEAFDKPESKAMLVNTALASLPNITVVAASGMAGFSSSNRIVTNRPMKRLYVCGDSETAAEPGRGLMAPRVQICAAHQANMILRLLVGQKES